MVWEGTARDPVWDRGLTSQLLGTDYTQLVTAGHKEQGCNMGAGASLWLAASAISVFSLDTWGGDWVSAWRSGDNLKESFLPRVSLTCGKHL